MSIDNICMYMAHICFYVGFSDWGLDIDVWEVYEEATRFHDEISAVNNENQMAGQSD